MKTAFATLVVILFSMMMVPIASGYSIFNHSNTSTHSLSRTVTPAPTRTETFSRSRTVSFPTPSRTGGTVSPTKGTSSFTKGTPSFTRGTPSSTQGTPSHSHSFSRTETKSMSLSKSVTITTTFSHTVSTSATITVSRTETFTKSMSTTTSQTITVSKSLTTSKSQTITLSRTLTYSFTQTVSSSLTLTKSTTLTATSTLTLTNSMTVSGTSSKTFTVTTTSSVSNTASGSQTTTVTLSMSDSSTESVPNVAVPGVWSIQTQTIDSLERSSGACDDTSLTIFGGRNGLGRVSNSMFTYTSESQWKEVSYIGNIPGLYDHQLVGFDDGWKYVFGGTTESGDISDDLWQFNPDRVHWSVLRPTDDFAPIGRSWFQMVAIPDRNSFVILFGRTSKVLETAVWEFNRNNNSWIELPVVSETGPTPRFATCCKYDNATSRVYCFGGTTPDGDVNELWTLTFANATSTNIVSWSKELTSDPPSPRRSAQCAIYQNSFLVTGGRDTEITGNTFHNDDVYVYFFVNNSWSTVNQEREKPTPKPRTQTPSESVSKSKSATLSLLVSGSITLSHSKTHTIPLPRTKTMTLSRTLSHSGSATPSVTFRRPNATDRTPTVVPPRTPTATMTLLGTPAPPQGPRTVPNAPPSFISAPAEEPVTIEGTPRESGIMCTSGLGVLIQGGRRDTQVLNDLAILENGHQFKTLTESRPFPGKRTDHVSFMVASEMFIAFGRDRISALNDVWAYDTTTNTWTEKTVENPPAARYGCSAAVSGRIVYFFGGLTSTTNLLSFTNELWQYDIDASIFKVVETTSDKSFPGRAYHQSVLYGRDILVLMGSTASHPIASDAWYYNAIEGKWIDVAVSNTNSSTPVTMSARLRFGINEEIVNSKDRVVTAFGGVATRPLADRWVLYPPVLNKLQGKVSMFMEEKLSAFPHGVRSRTFARGAAAVAGVGNRTFVCGGLIAEGSPPKGDESCYQYDRTTGLNSLFIAPPLQTAHSTGVYYGRSFYMFGGLTAQEGIVQDRGFVNTLQIYTVSEPVVCEANATEVFDSKCVHCSPGTVRTDGAAVCEGVKAGYYHWAPTEKQVPCPTGRFMNPKIKGAESEDYCKYCPAGFYADQEGSTECLGCAAGSDCRIGAQREQPKPVAEAIAEIDTIPDVFTPLVVPYSVWTTFGVVAFVMFVVVATVVGLRRKTMKARVEYYISPEQNMLLRAMYREFYVSGTGLRLADVVNILTDTRLPKNRVIETSAIETLFRKHDEDGSMSISFTEFRFLIFDLIDDGYLLPFPNSKREMFGPRSDPLNKAFKSISFKNIDKYYAEHRVGDMGDPIRLQKNANGGVLTIAFYLLFLIMLVALLVTFTFDNMVETRSSMPNTLITETFKASFEVKFSVEGPRSEGFCVDANGKCPDTTTVTNDAKQPLTAKDATTTCEYSDPVCDITWRCEECELQDTVANLNLQMTSDGAYAEKITIQATVFTGIHELETPTSSPDPRFSVSTWTIAAPNGTVIKGLPGTQVFGRVTQTMFRSPRSSWDQSIRQSEGYHLQSVIGRSVVGNTVTERDFGNNFGVPLQLQLELAPSTLVVVRTAKQTLIQLVTGILGAMSGLSGGILGLLVFLDRRAAQKKDLQKKKKDEQEQETEKHDTMMDEDAVFGTSVVRGAGESDSVDIGEESTLNADDIDDEHPQQFIIGTLADEERDLVTEIVKHDVSIFAAVNILRLIRKVSVTKEVDPAKKPHRRSSAWGDVTSSPASRRVSQAEGGATPSTNGLMMSPDGRLTAAATNQLNTVPDSSPLGPEEDLTIKSVNGSHSAEFTPKHGNSGMIPMSRGKPISTEEGDDSANFSDAVGLSSAPPADSNPLLPPSAAASASAAEGDTSSVYSQQ